jgi:hypothetical protein
MMRKSEKLESLPSEKWLLLVFVPLEKQRLKRNLQRNEWKPGSSAAVCIQCAMWLMTVQ